MKTLSRPPFGLIIAALIGMSATNLSTSTASALSLLSSKPTLNVNIALYSENRETEDWYKTQCAFFRDAAIGLKRADAVIRCQNVTNPNLLAIPGKLADNELHFHFTKDTFGELRLRAFYAPMVMKKDPTSVLSAEWKFNIKKIERGFLEKNRAMTEEELNVEIKNRNNRLKQLYRSVLHYKVTDKDVTEELMRDGTVASKTVKYEGGKYLSQKTGKALSFDEALATFQAEGMAPRNFLRASIETMVLLGIGTHWYYKNIDFNSVDWDFEASKSFQGRFTSFDAVRFDDNDNAINRKHITAGLGYYMFNRANGLKSYEALLMSFAGSSVWEYFVEFREVVSINDQIMTPMGGFVLGESLFQLARYLRSRRGNSVYNTVLSSILDPITGMHQLMDRREKNYYQATDYGFDPELVGKVELGIGMVKRTSTDPHQNSKKETRLIFDGEVTAIPMYESPGHVSALIKDTAFAKLLVVQTMTTDAVEEFTMLSKVVFAAYHEKNLGRDSEGNLSGYSLFVGPASGLHVHIDQQDLKDRDMIANVNVIGGMLDATYFFRGVKVRAQFDIYGDFAMVRSYSIEKFIDEGGDISEAPSVQRNQKHYYGGGFTTSAGLSIEYRDFVVSASASTERVSVIKGRSRFMEEVGFNPNASDRRDRQEIRVSKKVTSFSKVSCGVERVRRSGAYQTTTRTEYTKVVGCDVSVAF